jgi:hypothetical protein
VEEFGSPTCPNCPPVMARFKNNLLPLQRNIGIFWCVWYPGFPTPLMDLYEEVRQRAKKYSISGVPSLVSCGTTKETGSFAGLSPSYCGSLLSPYFIQMQNRFSSDSFCVQVTITVNQKTANPNRRLYVAAIEKDNSNNSTEWFITNGVTEYPRLFRKMVPDTNGVALPDTFYPGQPFVHEVKGGNALPWFINTNQAASVAFIQSTVQPFEVFQAEQNLTTPPPTLVYYSQAGIQGVTPKMIKSMKGQPVHLSEIYFYAGAFSFPITIRLNRSGLPPSWKLRFTDSTGVPLVDTVLTRYVVKSRIFVQVSNGGDTTANHGGRVDILVSQPGKSPGVLSYYIYNRITTLYADYSATTPMSAAEKARKSSYLNWLNTKYPGVSVAKQYLDTAYIERGMISPQCINSLVAFADSSYEIPFGETFPTLALLLVDRGTKIWMAGSGPIRHLKFYPPPYMEGLNSLVRNRIGASYKSLIGTGNQNLLKFSTPGIDTARLLSNPYLLSSVLYTGPSAQLEKIWAVQDTTQLVAFSRHIINGNRRLYTTFWPWQLQSDSSRKAIAHHFMEGTSSFITGVEEEQASERVENLLLIWPNPGQNGFYVERPGLTEVFDSMGKRVKSQFSNQKNSFFSMEGLPSGIFQVRHMGQNLEFRTTRYVHSSR